MKEEAIKKLLTQVKNEELTIDEACGRLKDLPYKDLGFANIDNHRALRTGFPEVVFCQGKTPGQIRDIMLELVQNGGNIMGTRATAAAYEAVKAVLPQARYYEAARIIAVLEADAVCENGADAVCSTGSRTGSGEEHHDAAGSGEQNCVGIGCEEIGRSGLKNGAAGSGRGASEGNFRDGTEKAGSENRHHKPGGAGKPSVAVVTAGTADIPVAEEAAVTAEILGNQVIRIYDVGVAGIHRLFDKLEQIRKADVVIVAAGMEGALASVVGGLVDVPVIAVPTSIGYGANLGGLSALLSMLNSCANGVGVVNIDNGFGAAYLAAVINRGKGR